LLEPQGVGFEPQAPVDQGDAQLVLPLLQERADGLDGSADDRREVDGFLPETDFSSGDAGDVQEVVNQSGEVLHLSEDHLFCPFELFFRLQLPEELSCTVDG
jgi:hypothetical protein